MKTCTKCKIEKPKAEFSKGSKNQDGLQHNCNPCCAAYRKANGERLRARNAEYYAANKEIILAQKSAYYFANNAANREKHAARSRAYYASNPEKASEKERNRRARKRNAEGKHTAADVRAIFESQRGLCANCQTKLFKSGAKKYHVDHIMPLALGGSNWPSNLQCLCPACNLSKGAKHPDDWASEQGRLI